MQKRIRISFLCVCISVLLLCGMPMENAVFAAEAATVQTTVTEVQTKDAPSKTVKMVGFLAIFTVACGGTAYLVMRPSLKKLKEAKRQAAQIKMDDSEIE